MSSLAPALSAIRMAYHLLAGIARAPSTEPEIARRARSARLQYPSIGQIRRGLVGRRQRQRHWRVVLLDARAVLEHYQAQGQDADLRQLAIWVLKNFPVEAVLKSDGERLVK